MTLSTLLWMFGVSALVLTIIVVFLLKRHKSIPMTFMQNFCGVWFLFSGWVKAVDPMGTAFKMVDYFNEFNYTFQDTWLSFIAPIFPFLSNYSLGFSVFMIVLEIVLGLMLIFGVKPKLTSWLFFIVLIFFTVLTGFTYMTGYVPKDANFFSFGSWGEYATSNMRVTDCGCFGDFLKLEPKISFFKDLFLMIPAIYFVWKHSKMHQLFTSSVRNILSFIAIVGSFVYCLSNFVWDLPQEDFRPFKVGVDVNAQRALEEQAQADVQILGWIFENENTGQVVEDMTPDYMAIYKNYPKDEGWKVKDQVKSEASMKVSKISEFEVTDFDDNIMTSDILNDENYSVMIVSYAMNGKGEMKTNMVMDSLFIIDTAYIANTTDIDSISRRFDKLQEREVNTTDYIWDDSYASDFNDIVKPFVNSAKAEGLKVYTVVGGAGKEQAADLKDELGLDFDFYTADDLLLKTIIRSNPGIVLWKNGKIVNKWHKKQLPSFDEVKNMYIK